jgi:nucleoside-diphosphate-sugar epimerase
LRTLVTGAGGFLGRYVVEQLIARGDKVRAFARGDYPDLKRLGAEFVRGDVREEEQVNAACQGIDAVFHTAAKAGIWGRWDEFYAVNTIGTRNIIAACQAHDVPRLIFTSSPSVTFSETDQLGVDETAPYPTKWICHYPHTKALAEQEVLAANGVAGLRTCSLRPHLIWGPRDRHLVPRLIERAKQRKLMRVGDGSNLIDTIYVSNAAEAHLQAADALSQDSAVAGQAYFLSQGKPVNCWDWIGDLLALAGLPPLERSISLRKAWFAGQTLETCYRLLGIQSEPRMTRFLAAQLATSHYFDISKSRHDFGYQPSISTEEGMQRLALWMQREGRGE